MEEVRWRRMEGAQEEGEGEVGHWAIFRCQANHC